MKTISRAWQPSMFEIEFWCSVHYLFTLFYIPYATNILPALEADISEPVIAHLATSDWSTRYASSCLHDAGI